MSSADELLAEEVEALQATYGEELISFRPRQSASVPACISISLEPLLLERPHPAGSHITLSALLPDGYPHEERPRTPTLRAGAVPAAGCAALVERMLQRQEVRDGQLCLFEYVEAMLAVLGEFSAEEASAGDGSPGLSAVVEVAGADKGEEEFQVFHGEPLTDRKSVFQAHAARVTGEEDVDAVLNQLKRVNRKIATATHNMLAYRVAGKGKMVLQDADDDGEKGAGKCVLYVLQQLGAVDVVCIVSRWFGGIPLGPARFKHICKVARDVVEENLAEFGDAERGKS